MALRDHSGTFDRLRRARVRGALTLALLSGVACAESANSVVAVANRSTARLPGVVEVTFRDVDTPVITARALVAANLGELASLRSDQAADSTITVLGSVPIELSLLTASSFIVIPANGTPVQYIRATFGIRNLNASKLVFDPTTDNAFLVAAEAASTIAQTQVTTLLQRDGRAVEAIVARQLAPTGFVVEDGSGGVVDLAPGILQIYGASAFDGFVLPVGVTGLLPYGFVALDSAQVQGFDDVVIVAFKLPHLLNGGNPATVSLLFALVVIPKPS